MENAMVPNYSQVIQSDACCFEGGIVSLGCVIKSTNDKILAASCQIISSLADVAIAELMGILWAMQLTLEHNLDNIVFQSNALTMVDCINDVSFSAALDLLMNDCWQLLKGFKNVVVVFFSRSFNIDAHHIVQVDNRFGSNSWTGVIPPLEEISLYNATLASSSL